MSTVLAIRHVAYEDLDGFEKPFIDRGFNIMYRDAWVDEDEIDALAPDILAVMGAPVGVYETDLYPFIRGELNVIEKRLAAGRPVLGVCFGGQLIAEVLGAKVYKGQSFEFGWGPLDLTQAGKSSPIHHYAAAGSAVFHCHGDTFDLPADATLLASTAVYENQAFSYGPHLALQFHGEVTERGLRRWYIGHAARIKAEGGLPALIEETARFAPHLEALTTSVINDWLETLCPKSSKDSVPSLSDQPAR